MRRPPIVCRRAVQSLQPPSPQHIWISDDLVASTFQRFVRNSCPQQKRHGSHVPGPLEARRRAAKRRMTVSAGFYPQENFPPAFSLSALFGFRANPQPSWRYEPPSLQADPQPLEAEHISGDPTPSAQAHETSPDSTVASTTTGNPSYSFAQDLAHRLEEAYIAPQSSSADVETARTVLSSEASRHMSREQAIAFVDAFKMHIAGAEQLAGEERHAFISQAFEEFRPASYDTSMYTVMVMRHMVELDWDPAPVLAQHSHSSFALPSFRSAEISGFLIDLGTVLERWPQHVVAIHAVHRRLAELVLSVPVNPSKPPYKDSDLMALVRQSWQSARMQSRVVEESACELLQSIARYVGNRFRRRRLLAALADCGTIELSLVSSKIAHDPPTRLPIAVEVLSCLPRKRLLQVIPLMVRHQLRKPAPQTMLMWMELIHQLDTRPTTATSSLMDKTMSRWTRYTFSDKGSTTDVRALLSAVVANRLRTETLLGKSTPHISEMLVALEAATAQDGRVTVGATVDALLSHLHKEGLPYESLVQDFLALIVQHAEMAHVVPFLRALKRRRVCLADTGPLQQFVAAKVTAVKSVTATTEEELERQTTTLLKCRTISWILGDISAVPTTVVPVQQTRAQRQFAHILTRAELDHALPLAYRNLTAPLSPDDSVQLIHHLAHQYSTDYTRTQRQSWRATYYLYKYLCSNSLYISPLFSKAIVRLSIIRPMSENRFVSARRVIWVCHIVARVEGESVARQLEANFWEWRGELIKHAKAVYVGVGGSRYDKAHIGTMKRLGLI